MTTISTILFWVSLSILIYCYIGYGILIFFLNSIRSLFAGKRTEQQVSELLPVTLVVTAYNEEKILEQKIRNTLAIDYPAGKLRVLIITDGSADASLQLVQQHPSILSLHEPERKGKYAAIKRAMRKVETPIVVFSDANTMLNPDCIKKIAVHYNDPKVGGVAGEKKISRQKNISAVGEAEGIYWQYESFLKKLDAEFNTVTGAAGELFSIRSSLFREVDDKLLLDDFVISMQICLQGYKLEYEPNAFATEMPSTTLAEEEKRKVRISAGAYQSVGYLKECLNIFKHPLLSFQYISRRLLRWIFCPLSLLLLFFSNCMLISTAAAAGFYSWAFYAQIAFYGLAFIGWIIVVAGKKAGWLSIPFYFVFMNYCLIKGLFKFLKGNQTVLWEKSLRQAID